MANVGAANGTASRGTAANGAAVKGAAVKGAAVKGAAVNGADPRKLMGKLTAARTALLLRTPFYGTLLMQLKFGLAPCGTACTDMRRILWDPDFLERLPQEEIEFVLLHELMHCVLEHLRRGKGKIHLLYNIAADIVVNSCIMEEYGVTEFKVDGEEAMHLAPNGQEGRKYTADQVYEMLLAKYQEALDDMDQLQDMIENQAGKGVDSHDIWENATIPPELEDEWRERIKALAKGLGSSLDLPPIIRELLDNEEYQGVIDWRQILNDFVQLVADSYDYTFTPADRRFADGDFILPSFYELEGEKIEDIWMLVDTSGSVDPELLTMIYGELTSALRQFTSFKAKLSCFDTQVTEPVAYESEEELKNIQLSGGGGTSFRCIFDYMRENMIDDLPAAVVVLTDGYADYPKEEAAMGVPVLWVIIDGDDEAPWGKSVRVRRE